MLLKSHRNTTLLVPKLKLRNISLFNMLSCEVWANILESCHYFVFLLLLKWYNKYTQDVKSYTLSLHVLY